MALSSKVQKTLTMKPEVVKIFEDLEEWLDHCRLNLLNFNERDLYKSHEYKNFIKDKKSKKNPNKVKKYGKYIPN